MSRILSKSKFGAGRDFEVTDTSGARVLFVDVKVGVTPNAEIRDAQDEVVYAVKGKFLGFPKRMTISAADGTHIVEAKVRHVHTRAWTARVLAAPLCCQPVLLRIFLVVVFPARLVGCSVGFAGPGCG